MTSLQEQLAALHTDTAAASTSAEATTATKLRTLMASIAGVTTEDIADNSLLIDDLGFQSLDLIGTLRTNLRRKNQRRSLSHYAHLRRRAPLL